MANKIVNHGLNNNLIKEFKNCEKIKPEVFFLIKKQDLIF